MDYEQSLRAINEQLQTHPELADVADQLRNGPELRDILELEGIGLGALPTIEYEVILVITLYVPLSELAQNIAESTHLPLPITTRVAMMVETLILEPIIDILKVSDVELTGSTQVPQTSTTIPTQSQTAMYTQRVPQPPAPAWQSAPPQQAQPQSRPVPQPTEPPVWASAQRPQTPPPPPPSYGGAPSQPLTRDQLMSALAAKRTMASDTEQVRRSAPPPSYQNPG